MTYTLGCMWGFGFFEITKYFAVGEDQNGHVDDMKLLDYFVIISHKCNQAPQKVPAMIPREGFLGVAYFVEDYLKTNTLHGFKKSK